VDAASGSKVYEQPLEIEGRRDKVYASLVRSGDKLYGVTRENGTIVLKAGAQFEEITRNDVGDPSVCNATPAIAGDRLLLRSDRYLYCIAE
jgi:hypothetical protein